VVSAVVLVVVDTNVLVASLITRDPGSPTARTLDAMLSGSFLFLLSPALLAEYRAVLIRPRLMDLHGLTEADIDEVLAAITVNALWREPQLDEDGYRAPDEGDAHLWALLASEPNAILITGDRLLLENPYPGRQLWPPAKFWLKHP
jgi:putative PIN family toxin of toxin-antitoxin system